MPIYEYRCEACGKLTSVLVRSARTAETPRCEHCRSRKLKRLISRVTGVKSERDVLDEYGAPAGGVAGPDAYRDPRQIGRWVEKRFEEYGMELPGETREMIDAAREGELPKPIKDL
ncbi:MAG: zinc ribbon domain-containing protein [Chloroflexi bacterium]|nr:zinc ribbon domain-containing protein [Chloroflexota bacterium]